ncbi:MAG: hypothetical protein VX725_01865, partial [Actinomycetota bacterium]|nr:hypothetical protein [Actinomycetota bacterium]
AGNASALITATLEETSPTTTQVNVKTELTITGKVAQFGRGAISDVSAKLMTQFAKNLEELLEPDENNVSTEATTAPPTQKDDEALNLLGVVTLPLLKRFGLPLLVFGAALFLIIWFSVS